MDRVTRISYQKYNTADNTYSKVRTVKTCLTISQWIQQNRHCLIVETDERIAITAERRTDETNT